jgi:ATP-binding cassette subfamily B protein
MKRREHLDYVRFKNNSLSQESINELIGGVQEIKLNNFEDYKINKWRKVQIETFKNNQQILKLNQIQSIGYEYINQIKNIIVTFFAAKLVITGHLTLGEMMSISFIIGQLGSPINQLIDLFKSFQDAKLSFSRLIDIQENENEEKDSYLKYDPKLKEGIVLENISFQYEERFSPYVLRDVSLHIPKAKTTAIVGASGCGKTTLLKLILKFYNPTSGRIIVDGINLAEMSPSDWRKNCGIVMQDTYIFSETIARNIAMSDIDQDKLENAIKLSNIDDYVQELAFKHNTIIGAMGNGLSNGQRQRLLIARVIYKNPEYIFLDEATSSLDTKNERTIYDNINTYFRGKTVVVIAHRLSTVKNADKIAVLDNGVVLEQGTHSELLKKKGAYYSLVSNQLEIDEDEVK